MMFTTDQSKIVLDRATHDFLPEISVSIKLGASDRTSSSPASTSLELRRYAMVSCDMDDEIL